VLAGRLPAAVGMTRERFNPEAFHLACGCFYEVVWKESDHEWTWFVTECQPGCPVHAEFARLQAGGTGPNNRA